MLSFLRSPISLAKICLIFGLVPLHFERRNTQSTVWKKDGSCMYILPRYLCEPNVVNRHTPSHILGEINPCINDIVYPTFEGFRTFLCDFMSSFRVALAMHLFRYGGYQFGVYVQTVLFVIVRVTTLQAAKIIFNMTLDKLHLVLFEEANWDSRSNTYKLTNIKRRTAK